ncbi:hypothetical protein PIB30_031125 [Stylosanthes scabra]|uniref:Uncharacterized protein n=1 Tax=Stylosanthes scabra TaxID=79078 RepID=A0ABU6WA94_9FABA|nr:hypothetical protein [Stylosanthes scabra]
MSGPSASHELMRRLASRTQRLLQDNSQVWFTHCRMTWTRPKRPVLTYRVRSIPQTEQLAVRIPSPVYIAKPHPQ